MKNLFEILAEKATEWTGSTIAAIITIGGILLWTLGGFVWGFSEGYQLLINTITTLATTAIVVLLQRAQNKDSIALQMKLNELIASHDRASNRLLNIEDLSESEIQRIRNRYRLLAGRCKGDESMMTPHSVEEIEDD